VALTCSSSREGGLGEEEGRLCPLGRGQETQRRGEQGTLQDGVPSWRRHLFREEKEKSNREVPRMYEIWGQVARA
jgi:hypothetical protein